MSASGIRRDWSADVSCADGDASVVVPPAPSLRVRAEPVARRRSSACQPGTSVADWADGVARDPVPASSVSPARSYTRLDLAWSYAPAGRTIGVIVVGSGDKRTASGVGGRADA